MLLGVKAPQKYDPPVRRELRLCETRSAQALFVRRGARAVGAFDGTKTTDLATGTPRRDLSGIGDRDAASLLYGALFASGIVSGDGEFWEELKPST